MTTIESLAPRSPVTRPDVVIAVASIPNPEDCQNPYLRLLYKSQEEGLLRIVPCPGVRFRWLWRNARNIDILHIHWPSFLYESPNARHRWKRLATVLAYFRLAKALGIKLVWTLHNVMPHQRMPGRIDVAARRALLGLVDHVVAHEPEAVEEARRCFRRRFSWSIVPHMSYRGAYPEGPGRDEARHALQLPQDARVYLYLGAIRPNKRVPQIIRAFRSARQRGEYLVVAGAPATPHQETEVCKAKDRDDSVRLHLKAVPDSQVALFHEAADLGVIGSRITTSGTMYLHLTYDLPVITPLETFPKRVLSLPCSIAYEDPAVDLAEAIAHARSINMEAARAAAREVAEQRHPDKVSRQLAEVFRKLVEGRNST